eukprot:scaffold1924_cov121-Skeletonema_dohrnii-CCMP3373.AAC.3
MRVVEAAQAWVAVDGGRIQSANGWAAQRTELVWNDFKLLHAGIGLLILASVLVFGSKIGRRANQVVVGTCS